jgi:hypothetical protein
MRPTDCVTDTEYPLVVSGRLTEVNVTMPPGTQMSSEH